MKTNNYEIINSLTLDTEWTLEEIISVIRSCFQDEFTCPECETMKFVAEREFCYFCQRTVCNSCLQSQHVHHDAE